MSKYVRYNGKLYKAVDIAGKGGEVSPKVAEATKIFAIKQEKKVCDLIRKAISAVKGGTGSWLQASLAARKYIAEAKSVAHSSYTKIENAVGKRGIYGDGSVVSDLAKIYGKFISFVNVTSYFANERLSCAPQDKNPGEVREAKAAALKQLNTCLSGF